MQYCAGIVSGLGTESGPRESGSEDDPVVFIGDTDLLTPDFGRCRFPDPDQVRFLTIRHVDNHRAIECVQDFLIPVVDVLVKTDLAASPYAGCQVEDHHRHFR